MPLSKKIFFISLASFCVTLLFFGIYHFAFKDSSKATSLEEKRASVTPSPAAQIKISTEPIVAITEEPVLAPILTDDMLALKYYAKNTGRLHQIDFNGNNKRTLSDKELPNLVSVLWSPDKNKVITEFITAEKTNFYYYNHAELKGFPLRDNVDEIAWQNSSNRIFYKYYDSATKKRTLNISNPDGTNWTKLAEINFRNISIAQIPGSGLVSFWNKPDAFFETNFRSVPTIGGGEKNLLKGLFGADYLWNANGNSVLVSHADTNGGTKIQLSRINSNGGELRNLNFPTFISKCIWLRDNKTVYCAMPGKIPDSAIMPNDYTQEKFRTSDTFWKIDTETGEKTRIIELEKIDGEYDATNLLLNLDESILFFVNKADQKLYRILL